MPEMTLWTMCKWAAGIALAATLFGLACSCLGLYLAERSPRDTDLWPGIDDDADLIER